MPVPHRRTNGPTTPQSTEPASPEAPEPQTSAVDLETIAGGGSNAQRVIDDLLGGQEDRRTGDTLTDSLAAMHEIDEWLRALALRRALVLHAIHAHAPRDEDRWQWVTTKTGRRAKSTVHDWAHVDALRDQG